MSNKIEQKVLSVDLIELNEGQIGGLDRNPRQWTYDDVQKLCKSIQETPELLEARGLIVYPLGDRYVAIGGNMRLCAVRMLEYKEVPCMVLPESMSVDKLAEIAIKDNGQFGSWDIEKLKANWSDINFDGWGIDVKGFDDPDENEDEEHEKPTKQMDDSKKEFSVVFSADEFAFVNNELREIGGCAETGLLTVLGYYEANAQNEHDYE